MSTRRSVGSIALQGGNAIDDVFALGRGAWGLCLPVDHVLRAMPVRVLTTAFPNLPRASPSITRARHTQLPFAGSCEVRAGRSLSTVATVPGIPLG